MTLGFFSTRLSLSFDYPWDRPRLPHNNMGRVMMGRVMDLLCQHSTIEGTLCGVLHTSVLRNSSTTVLRTVDLVWSAS